MSSYLRKTLVRNVGQSCMALFIALGAMHSALAEAPERTTPRIKLDVPFVPTPPEVVEKMLDLADVQPSDFLIDLGAGDGRIAIAAVRDRGARGAFGVDIDPERVAEARAGAEEAGIADKVTFEIQDLFETDFSQASVVSMYLLPDINIRLRPKVLDMAPGTRIVSHAFDMGGWYADTHARVGNRDVYLWIVPAKVDGTWTVSGPDGDFSVNLEQSFQELTGSASMSGQQDAPLTGQLRGNVVQFDVGEEGNSQRYIGRVQGDTIEAVPGQGTKENWRAVRS